MRKHALKLVSFLSLALAVALFAPQRAKADDDDDPPSRVARLSYTHGAVSFNPAGTDDWVSAVVNRPITTGDKLWTDNGARAELHIGSAAIRLSGSTGFSFLNLSDNVAQIRVTEGTINIRVRSLGDDETFEVDTPNLAFSILRPGRYRINVNEEGDTTVVVVRDGEGEVTGAGSAYTLHPREVGTFIGFDQLDADVERYRNDDDDFDHFCYDRDRREDRSISSRYVSRDVIGYEDLDDYGGWRPVPEYGTVWFPHTVIVGWAPYRYGHWAWISPWGWTWVDDEPWGFAPFHYGRWVVVRGVWGWVPCPPAPVVEGVAYVRPVYAPALVAWVGGPHFSLSIAIGGGGDGVAWFPLGPREVYVPSYHVSRTYVNNVNVTNTTVNNTYVTNVYNNTVVNNTNVVNNSNVNVTNIKYVNQSVPGAVTATSHASFTSAQPVAKNMIKVDAKEVASAQLTTTAAPVVAPPKQAVLGAGAPSTVRPPAAVADRAVVAKVAPPPPPVPFERQQQAIKANGGKPIGISEARQLQSEREPSAVPPVKIAPPANSSAPQNVQGNRPGNAQINQGKQPVAPANAGQPPANSSAPQNVQGNRSGNAQINQGKQPVAPANTGQPPANSSVPQNVQGNRPGNTQINQGNRPVVPANEGQPQANTVNKPATVNNQPPNAGNPKVYNDRPPGSRPDSSSNVNMKVDQRQKPDQERPRIQQQQEQPRNKPDQEPPKIQQQQQQEPLRNKPDQERPRIQQQQEQPRNKPDQEPPKIQQQQQQESQRLQQKNADERRQQQVDQKRQQQLPQLEQKHEKEQQKPEQKQQRQEAPKEKPQDKQPKEKPDKPPNRG